MKNIISQWQDMTDAEQIAMLTACTIKALQIEIPAAALARFNREHETDELVSAAWLKLYDRLQPTYLDALNASRAGDGKYATLHNATDRNLCNSVRRFCKKEADAAAPAYCSIFFSA